MFKISSYSCDKNLPMKSNLRATFFISKEHSCFLTALMLMTLNLHIMWFITSMGLAIISIGTNGRTSNC